MEDQFDVTLLFEIARRDTEFSAAITAWDGDKVTLYKEALPQFETFLSRLPKELTIVLLEELLLREPVGVRLLFFFRLFELVERMNGGYTPPVYKNLWDIIIGEWYQNHPDKIRYQDSE